MPSSSTPTEKLTPRARATMWSVMIFLVVAFSLGGAEAITRLAHIRPFRAEQVQYIGWALPDSVLGWRNNPGVHRAHEGAHEPMTILSDGSRANGTPGGTGSSVLVVGCSNVEGYGVRDDETFPARLQRRFPDLSIHNFGVPGYGTYQTLLLLKELIEQRGLHPALVIYGFIPYHAERNVLTYSMLEAFRVFGGERFSPPHVELRGSGLQAFPPFVVSDWPLEGHSALVTLLHRTELRARLSGRERDEEEATRLLLVEMKGLVEGAGGRLLVATLWDMTSPGPDSYRRMSDQMRRSGIEEIDITYRGPETKLANLLVGGNGHPNAIVHAWWADRLAGWLEKQGLDR